MGVQPERSRAPSRGVASTGGGHLVWLLVGVLLVGTAVAGGILYQRRRSEALRDAETGVVSLADAKVIAVRDWLDDRVRDAELLRRHFLSFPAARHLLGRHVSKTPPLEGIRDGLTTGPRYDVLLLLDPALEVVACDADPAADASPPESAFLARLGGSSEVALSDLVRDESGTLHLDVGVGMFTSGEGREFLGALVLRVDAEEYLVPVLALGLRQYESERAYLVRREGEEAVVIGDPAASTPGRRASIDRLEIPAVRAALGHEGSGEGTGFFGARLIAATRRVPGTSWGLVARVEADRVVAAAVPSAWIAMLLTGAVAAAGIVVGAISWRQGLRRHRAESEASLLGVRARLDAFGRAANDGFLLVDDDIRILDANEKAAAMHGYGREEMTGRSVSDLLAPGARPTMAAVGQSLATVGEAVFETTHVRRDGTAFPVEASVRRIEGVPGIAGVAVLRDISERKSAEARLRESEALLRECLDAVPTPMAILDERGVVARTNAAWDRRAEERRVCLAACPTGTDFFARVPEGACAECAMGDGVRDGLRRVAYGQDGTFDVEHSCRRAHPAEWQRVQASRFDVGGRPHVVLAVEDVSARKRAEEALHEKEEQFLQAQKMEAIGRLAGGVAHDFNNLLTVIGGYAQLVAQRVGGSESLRRPLDQILSASTRASHLTRQLLAFSRRQAVEPRVVDLNQVVRGFEDMLRRLIGEDVVLETSLDPDVEPVLVDPGQVEQVLMNLAVNARDAMPSGGRLSISTAPGAKREPSGPGEVVLAVRDTGTGISAEALPHLFEPFFTTKAPGKGTGLGLATVYGIVTQAGGRVEVRNRPGEGAEFLVHWPVASAACERTRPDGPNALPAGGSESLLLVEDEDDVRRFAAEVLVGAGYRVRTAASVAEAHEVLEAVVVPIDLVVTDLVMPGGSGVDLAREARARRPDLRVLFVTGHSGDVLLGEARSAGPLLHKPFSPAALLLAVRRSLCCRQPAVA